MKICKIYIKGFQQFQDVELDLTNPETGEPVEKVCFIGSNGTGKTILLKEIKNALNFVSGNGFGFENFGHIRPLTIFEFFTENRFFYCIFSAHQVPQYCFFSEKRIIDKDSLSSLKRGEDIAEFLTKIKNSINASHNEEMIAEISRKKTLFINSPAEAIENSSLLISDVPETSVNEALSLNKSFPTYALVSSDKINEFWKILVYNLRKRAEDRDNYENLPDNLSKTKKLLIEEFDGMEPKVLHHLNNVWNKVLDKAGLYFDVEGASNPYQLNDNLKAYIRLKSNGKHIPYNELSTGIRNYIFRIGHIFSLYFNREIDLGFLLVDEPENSLYPDFLFELTEIYQQIVLDKRGQNNTQMFFATHNPIIAAQFKPYERIILDWKEDGTVQANKGTTPEGDDPNDILKKDFGLHQLMGTVGIQQWHKYFELKKKLKEAKTTDEKMGLASQVNEIGRLYNFPA
jgi:hypothetical protein